MNQLLQILDRPIAFHSIFVDLTGSITAALMLSQAFYWSKRTKDPDGWFYKNQEEWQEETRLSRAEQETARKQLRGTGFWFEERRGIPARLYYRIDLEKLESSLRESSILECDNPADSNAGMSHSSTPESSNLSNSSETTAEITHIRARADFNQRRSLTLAKRHGPTPQPKKEKPNAIEIPETPEPAAVKALKNWGAKLGFEFAEMNAMWEAFRLKHLDEHTPPQTMEEWVVKFQRYVSNCHLSETLQRKRRETA